MFRNRLVMLLVALVVLYTNVQAQTGEFCDGVNTVLKDAQNNFTNIQGRIIESGNKATIWTSTVQVPGGTNHQIVNSTGFFYEGAFAQTTNKDELMAVYGEYKRKLHTCLVPLGYKLSYQSNGSQGLSDYKKVVFTKDVPPGTPKDQMPPHVTLEANYNRDLSKYTLIIDIFSH